MSMEWSGRVVELSTFERNLLERIAQSLEKLAENQPVPEFPGERSSILDYIDTHYFSGRTLSEIFEEIRNGKHLK